jgi:hypothetical protein
VEEKARESKVALRVREEVVYLRLKFGFLVVTNSQPIYIQREFGRRKSIKLPYHNLLRLDFI